MTKQFVASDIMNLMSASLQPEHDPTWPCMDYQCLKNFLSKLVSEDN